MGNATFTHGSVSGSMSVCGCTCGSVLVPPGKMGSKHEALVDGPSGRGHSPTWEGATPSSRGQLPVGEGKIPATFTRVVGRSPADADADWTSWAARRAVEASRSRSPRSPLRDFAHHVLVERKDEAHERGAIVRGHPLVMSRVLQAPREGEHVVPGDWRIGRKYIHRSTVRAVDLSVKTGPHSSLLRIPRARGRHPAGASYAGLVERFRGGLLGRPTTNVVPPASDEFTSTSPPCARAISRTMYSPSPNPQLGPLVPLATERRHEGEISARLPATRSD
jgi:hypothetical protein